MACFMSLRAMVRMHEVTQDSEQRCPAHKAMTACLPACFNLAPHFRMHTFGTTIKAASLAPEWTTWAVLQHQPLCTMAVLHSSQLYACLPDASIFLWITRGFHVSPHVSMHHFC